MMFLEKLPKCLALIALFAAAEAGAEVLALTNFTLIDGTADEPAPGSAMLIEDGRITWTGEAGRMQAPAEAHTVDLSGKFVMPGLIDLHTHIGNTCEHALAQDVNNYTRDSVERALETYAAYGVTAVLVMGTDSDLIFTLRSEQHSEVPSRARIFTAGQGIVFKNGYGGVAGLNRKVATPEEARRQVALQAEKGVDVIKLWVDDEFGTMPKMPPEISKATIEAAHRHKLRVLAHVFYLEDAKRLVDQGIDGFVHTVRDRGVDRALIDGMKAGNVWQMGTLSREASMVAYGEPAPFLDDPFFTRSVSPEVLAILRDPERQETIAAGPHFSDYKDILRTAMDNYAGLAGAGVKHVMGTDSGPPGRFGGYSAHWELELMVEAGLTPRQALIAATSGAAGFLDFLGASPDIGTLESGNWADLVVLDANPLEDIRNTRALHSIYIAGRPIEPINP